MSTINIAARPGDVYILTNDSMPGLVKIGRTSREPDIRAAELWQTGVPTPFAVYARERTFDCVQLEAFLHGQFRSKRVHAGREFFAVDPEAAREQLTFWASIQASLLINDHFDCVAVQSVAGAVSEGAVERLASEAGESPRLIADALEDLTVEEIAAAIARVKAKRHADERATLIRLGLAEAE